VSFKDLQKYPDNQVILTSDRLVFNAKLDSIFLITKKDVAISSGGSLHINTGEKVIVNSPKVIIGIGNDAQPVAKGDNLVAVLTNMINSLISLSASLTTATATGVGVASLITVNQAGTKLGSALINLQSQLDSIKSTITYTN
jgi:hypothetical protein